MLKKTVFNVEEEFYFCTFKPKFQGWMETWLAKHMTTVRSAVAVGLIATSAAFTGSLPMTKAPVYALASQRPPALRQSQASNLKVGDTRAKRECVGECVRDEECAGGGRVEPETHACG